MKCFRSGVCTVALMAWAAMSSPVQGQGGKAIGVAEAPKRGTTGARWAIVIGVNDYQDTSIPKLRFCVADARLVYDVLHKRAGFSTKRMLLMTDDIPRFSDMPTRANILRRLGDFLSFAKPDDTHLSLSLLGTVTCFPTVPGVSAVALWSVGVCPRRIRGTWYSILSPIDPSTWRYTAHGSEAIIEVALHRCGSGPSGAAHRSCDQERG